MLLELERIVGAAHARKAAAGDAIDGVRARYVAAPGSVEEASALLRLAHDASLALAPRGGGTRLGWGNPPARLDLIVETARLDRVLEHAAGDLVVRVQAGVTLERLQRALRRHGQLLALDPPDLPVPTPSERKQTVGGIIAV